MPPSAGLECAHAPDQERQLKTLKRGPALCPERQLKTPGRGSYVMPGTKLKTFVLSASTPQRGRLSTHFSTRAP